MPRLLYATPTGKHPTFQYVLSQRAVEMATRSFGARHPRDFQFALGPVQMARSEIARQVIAGRCHVEHRCVPACKPDPFDYVIMHDDDVSIFPQGGVSPLDAWLKLFEADPSVGVIGALYMREKPLLVNLTVPHPQHPTELCHVVFGMPDQPFEAGGIATGFMMIRREVFEALGEQLDAQGGGPMFSFATRTTAWGTRHEVGEDYDFCVRVREAGFKVLADPRWTTTHIKDRGPLVYEHAAWEQKWTDATSTSGCLRELQEACPPTYRLMKLDNGLVILDHTEQRKLDAQTWRKRRGLVANADTFAVSEVAA